MELLLHNLKQITEINSIPYVKTLAANGPSGVSGGVTIVATLKGFGMSDGPAMTLLLSAPAVSLPSILALIPIAGAKRAAVFLALVVLFSALSGLIFVMTF